MAWWSLKLTVCRVQDKLLSILRNSKESLKAQEAKSSIEWSNFRVERNHFSSTTRIWIRTSYINDVPGGISSLCKICANNASLFSKVCNINKPVNKNVDLEKFSQWAINGKFNVTLIPKNKQMKLFSLVNLIQQTFSICLLSLVMISLLSFLIKTIALDSRLNFNHHVLENF